MKEPEVLPPEPPPPPPRFPRNRLVVALAVATVSDLLSILFVLSPPAQWATDVATALVLFAILGWQWVLLPGLIMEAIPGVYVFPFWVLAVAAVAMWGTVRPGGSGRGFPPDPRWPR